MNDRRQKTISDAVYTWEIGMLDFLLENNLIDETEYNGIRNVIEAEQQEKLVSI